MPLTPLRHRSGMKAIEVNEEFLTAVAELIVADENRADTSGPARTIREYLVDRLNRPDPLGHITPDPKIKERLEYLRGELRAERISYGELAELADLAPHIDPSDVELLEAAGVPEDSAH